MKKIISTILVFVMVLSLGSFSVFAEDAGYSIDGNVITITSGAGWDYIATNSATYASGYTIKITADIDASTQFATLKGSTIIGEKADGTKPVITNKIGKALIAVINNGAVRNLTLTADTTLTNTSNYAGALADGLGNVGSDYDIVISGIENNCSVTRAKKFGVGMIGCILIHKSTTAEHVGNIRIEDCVNKGNMNATSSAGGILGGIHVATTTQSDNDNFIIRNCKNYGTISSSENYAGGIFGADNTSGTYMTNGSLKIEQCANYGNVSTTNKYAAGILGKAHIVNISETFNQGSISCPTYPAAIVGGYPTDDDNMNINISNCYNGGNIISTGKYSCGIIVNQTSNVSLSMNSVYSAGQMTTTDATKAYVVSYTLPKNAVVENVYYKEGVGGGKTADYEKLTAKTDAGFEQLPDGFSSDYWISLEGEYPVLKNNLPTNSDGTPITYHTVTLENGENGTAYKDEETLVKDGEKYTLTVAADEGYQIDTVSNLTEVIVNSYKTDAVTGDITVSVTYKEIPKAEGFAEEADIPYSSSEFTDEDGNPQGFNIVHFAKYIPKADAEVVYGIEISEDNFATVLYDGVATKATESGEYGVRFFGTKIINTNTYYLRPYVSYDGGEKIYGTVITYTPDEN